MLEIHNVEGLDIKNLNIIRKKTKKGQILLYDTGRRTQDFINKLKYRNFGKYDKPPHFIITKLGVIYQIFDTKYYSKTFGERDIDKQFIKISIENLGWLTKNTITGFLSNWIGDPYRAEPYVKNWRNYTMWDKYSDEQMKSIESLCKVLCEDNNIPKNIVSSQTYLENILNFNGVVCKSNFSTIYTDINPSFNFTEFFKNENTEINGI